MLGSSDRMMIRLCVVSGLVFSILVLSLELPSAVYGQNRTVQNRTVRDRSGRSRRPVAGSQPTGGNFGTGQAGVNNGVEGADPVINQSWPPKFTAQQRTEAQQLTASLRKKVDLSELKDSIQYSTNLLYLQTVQGYLKKELGPGIQSYQKTFTTVAQQAVGAKVKKADFSQVKTWFANAKAARDGNLTKEQVTTVVEPIVNQMLERCWLEPEEVTEAKSSVLTPLREKVMENADLWNALAESWNRQVDSFPEAPLLPTMEQMIGQIEFDAILSAVPATQRGKQVLQMNRNLAFSVQIEEARCISMTNRYRMLLGLEPQLIDVNLCCAARDHSSDMKNLSFFSHTSPVKGKEGFAQRAERFGVRGASSENIYMGSKDGYSGADAWFHSPGHHKNMLNDAARIGVGIFQDHQTQMTARN